MAAGAAASGCCCGAGWMVVTSGRYGAVAAAQLAAAAPGAALIVFADDVEGEVHGAADGKLSLCWLPPCCGIVGSRLSSVGAGLLCGNGSTCYRSCLWRLLLGAGSSPIATAASAAAAAAAVTAADGRPRLRFVVLAGAVDVPCTAPARAPAVTALATVEAARVCIGCGSDQSSHLVPVHSTRPSFSSACLPSRLGRCLLGRRRRCWALCRRLGGTGGAVAAWPQRMLHASRTEGALQEGQPHRMRLLPLLLPLLLLHKRGCMSRRVS